MSLKRKFTNLATILLIITTLSLGFAQAAQSPTTDVFNFVAPKLTTKSNDFMLKQPIDLVSKASADDLASTQSSSYVVLDFDSGKILAQKNLEAEVPIASLTKLMTAVVALDLASKDELFAYSQNAADQPATKLAFSPGDKLTLDELLNAALLTSANDCVEAIREGINTKYHGDVFVRAMNEKAKFLKLDDTHFESAQGYDGPNRYSSAHDLAILTHYALANYPEIAQIVAKDHGDLPPTAYHSREEYLNNWNGLLGVYPGVIGGKIGNTRAAKTAMIVLSEREGKKVLVVLLGVPDILSRDLYAAQLLDFGFKELANLPPANITTQQLLNKYASWKY